MNKRIKKKHNRKIMIGRIVNLKNPWNTNTPHWKRIKASGRKRKMYYDIHCTCTPNRNNTVRSIEFKCSKMEMKETDATSRYIATYLQHLHNGEVTKYGHIFR